MRTIRRTDGTRPHSIIFFLLLSVLLTGCGVIKPMAAAINPAASGKSPSTPDAPQVESTTTSACAVTESVLVKPPDDAAVQGSPEPGYYYINEDSSIWASAWWTEEAEEKEFHLRAGEEGNKVGWFRPAGAELEISGRRLDAKAPPLQAHVPCCYPTRFQATGLIFPTGGCWEVTAKAAGSLHSFIVRVEP